jgi:hypothetical protein
MLGENCNPATIGSWDNVSGCNWNVNGSQEVDISEAANPNSNGPGTLDGNIFCCSSGGGASTTGGYTPSSFTSNFHLYAIDWTSSGVTWYVDGSQVESGGSAGTDAMFLILESRQSGGNGSVLTQPTMTIKYVQVCNGAFNSTYGNGCGGPNDSATSQTVFLDDFGAPPPTIDFIDITSGTNSGGDTQGSYSGAYVTLYGNNFGSSQGSSTVTWNGLNCLRVVPATGGYTGWGMAVPNIPNLQKIIVQLGTGCTAGTGNFVVTVNGVASTSPSTGITGTSIPNNQFTVRSTGRIRCVAASGGSDSNSGAFGACWATPSGAISNAAAGDVIYVENGVSQTAATAFSAVVNIEGNPGGTSTNPIAMVTYPGASATIGQYSSSGNPQYAIRVPQIGDSPAYYTFAGLTVRGNESFELYEITGTRLVANDISCDFATGFGCTHIDTSSLVWQYGNYIHDMGLNCALNTGNPTGAPCKCHATYYTTNTSHSDFAWNVTNTTPIGSGLPVTGYQYQDYSTGGADQFDIHVHDNLFENSGSGSVNLSTINPNGCTGVNVNNCVEVYNNVIVHTGYSAGPSGTIAGNFAINSGPAISVHSGAVLAYNNSIYDAGSGGTGSNSNGCFNVNVQPAMQVVNNVCQSTGSGELYLTTESSSVTCSNFASGSTVNDFYGNGSPTCTSNVTSSLNVNPLYTSTTSGAWNLLPQSSSPLFSAGSTTLTSVYDYLSITRPSPPSIGAYEYSAGTQTSAPAVSFSPTSVAFGNQPNGTPATPIADTLTNTGTATLTISAMNISGTNASDFGFSTSPSTLCGTSIAAAGTCTITFTFTPGAVGARSATFSMSDNASGSPHTIPLSGTGTPSPAVTPTFSPVAGTYGSAQNVAISTTSTGAIICWNTTGAPATNGTTGCTTGTKYTGAISVNGTETIYAVAGGTGYSDSPVGSATYTLPVVATPSLFAKAQ